MTDRATLAISFTILAGVLADIALSHPELERQASFGVLLALTLGIMQAILRAGEIRGAKQ